MFFYAFIQYMETRKQESKESMEEKCVKRDTDHIHKSSRRLLQVIVCC